MTVTDHSDDTTKKTTLHGSSMFRTLTAAEIAYTQELRELKPGQILGRKYELLEEAGKGAMGFVWKAKDSVSGLLVALKFVPLNIQSHERMIEEMRNVFLRMQRLHHPNICPMLALEKDDTYGYFQVMDWLDGMTLDQYRNLQPGRKLPPEQVPMLLEKVAEALDFTHENGILHRDVKPSNIFLNMSKGSNPSIQLIDFGISTDVPNLTIETRLIRMETSGTPAYMALEQHLGQKQDAQTDQFSLAVVAYELYAGELPFEGKSGEQLVASILQTEPSPILDLPDYTNAALARALSKQRKDRFSSCTAFIRALRASGKEGNQSQAVIPPPVVNLQDPAQTHPPFQFKWPSIWSLVSVSCLLVLAALVLWGWYVWDDHLEMAVEWNQAMDQQEDSAPNGETRLVQFYDGVVYAFRWCPAGTFLMGSPADEEGRDEDEGPQVEMTLDKGFWMLETEVTQAMWESVMGSNPSSRQGEKLPVEEVSWEECQQFCQKLSQIWEKKVTLPSEIQWEYACRAGTRGAYAGKNLDDFAWYSGNANQTHLVAQKQPNAWGLFDMHGNVYELCQSGKFSYSLDGQATALAEANASTETADDDTTLRVFRGGSWGNSARYCRAAFRDYCSPKDRAADHGFRIILSLE